MLFLLNVEMWLQYCFLVSVVLAAGNVQCEIERKGCAI